MSQDTSLLSFSSEFIVDKIQSWATLTDASVGNQSGFSTIVPANPSPGMGVIEGTGNIANTYGKRGLPHLSWSIDKLNWYSTGSQILYFNNSINGYITQIAVFMVSSDTQLTFVVATGYTAAQTLYLQFAVDNPT